MVASFLVTGYISGQVYFFMVPPEHRQAPHILLPYWQIIKNFGQDIPVVFKNTYIKKRSRIKVYTKFVSYMQK